MIALIRYFLRKIRAHKVGACSAQVAFFMLFAFVPLLILLFSLIAVLPISVEDSIEDVSGFFPSLMGNLFHDVIRNASENGSSMMTSVSALAIVWSASKGVYYLISGLNSVFEAKETRNFIKIRALAIVYTIFFVVILVGTLVFFVFGKIIIEYIVRRFPHLFGLMNLFDSLRFVIGLLFLTFFFAMLYKVLPDRKTAFAEQFPGALFSAVGWVLFSFFFSFYINNFSDYANVYGSLAAIIVFMLWMYTCMFILFLGAELNLLIGKCDGRD